MPGPPLAPARGTSFPLTACYRGEGIGGPRIQLGGFAAMLSAKLSIRTVQTETRRQTGIQSQLYHSSAVGPEAGNSSPVTAPWNPLAGASITLSDSILTRHLTS